MFSILYSEFTEAEKGQTEFKGAVCTQKFDLRTTTITKESITKEFLKRFSLSLLGFRRN